MRLYGLLVLAISISLLIATERCRRNPYTCVDGFTSREGFTRSFVVLWHWKKSADEREKLFLENQTIRHLYILEGYLWTVIALISAIVLLAMG